MTNNNSNPGAADVRRLTSNGEPSLSETIRQAQSEAIAESFQVRRVGPAPLLPAEPSGSEVPNLKSKILVLLIASLLLCASAFSPFAPVQKSSAFLAEVAAPTANALGSWLISAAAVLSLFALGKQLVRKTPIEAEFLTKKEFNEFRDKVDTSFNSLRDRIDNSHDALGNKLDAINNRLGEMNSLVARVDERTKNRPTPSDRSTINHQPSTVS